MGDVSGVVTRKGQITLPAQMRDALGIRIGDRVVFRLDDGAVVVQPASGLVDRLIDVAGKAARTVEPAEPDAVASGFAEDEDEQMEELGIVPAVHRRQRAPQGHPPGSS